MLNRIKRYIKSFLIGLSLGIKKADTQITGYEGGLDSKSIGIAVKQDSQSVMEDLLKGELTERVEELRYRIYRIIREADNYNVIVNPDGTVTARREDEYYPKPTVYEGDGMKVILCQDNEIFKYGLTDRETYQPGKTHRPDTRIKTYLRDGYYPKIYINDKIQRIAVKRVGPEEDNKFQVDLYFYKLGDTNHRISVVFANMVSRLIEKGKRDFIEEIEKVEFMSKKCYGARNLYQYEFSNLKYVGGTYFNQWSILSFQGEGSLAIDPCAEFYIDEVEQDYQNKAPKANATFDLRFGL